MKYEEYAKTIIENVGGEENMVDVHHCITRLRFGLLDESKLNQEAIEKIPIVQGMTKKGSQYQIILGGKVTGVYDAVISLLGGEGAAKENKEKREELSAPKKILDYFTGSITPIVPALMAAGIIQSLIAIIDYFGILSADSTTYTLLTAMGQAGIYFVPVMLAVSAAKKLKSNIYLALIIAGILISPEYTGLVSSGVDITFLGIHVPAVSYGSTFIPILLVIPLLSLVEKLLNRIPLGVLKPIIVPAFSVLITAPIALIFLAPLANTISEGLSHIINWLYYDTSYFGAFIIGATSPFIVLTGLHTAVSFPILLSELTTMGGSIYFAILTMANISVGGAALGTALKTKNKTFKGEAIGAGITGVIGISEPALFGVLLRVKRPLIASGIASGIAGVCVILFGIHTNGLALGGFGGLPVFFGESLIPFIVVALADMVLAAILAYVIGFKDIQETSYEKSTIN